MYKVFRLPGGSGENPGPGKIVSDQQTDGGKKNFSRFSNCALKIEAPREIGKCMGSGMGGVNRSEWAY